MSVQPSGTNGIPIGQEYWKQQAEKDDALEKGQPEWNVPVGKEEGEAKEIKQLKCNFKKLKSKSELKQLRHNGANVISSKVTVYKKVKDGYEVEMPAGESCKCLKSEEKFINTKLHDIEEALNKIKASLPEAEQKEFDKDPVKYIREHRSNFEAFRKQDNSVAGLSNDIDNLLE